MVYVTFIWYHSLNKLHIPGSSNGRTAAFGAANHGSNPCPGTFDIYKINPKLPMDHDQQIAQQKIEGMEKLLEEFIETDFKLKTQLVFRLHGYSIQIAVVSATILGLVSVLGQDITSNPFAILGIIFLAVSVVGGLFYPLYSSESDIIGASKAFESAHEKISKAVKIWTEVFNKEKTVEAAEREHLQITKDGIGNP